MHPLSLGSSLASSELCHPTIPVHLAFECPQHPQLLTWGSAVAPGSRVPAHGPPGPSSLCLSPVILSASLSLHIHLKARAFCRRHAGLRCAHLGHRLGFIYSDAPPHLRVLSELLSLAPHPPGGIPTLYLNPRPLLGRAQYSSPWPSCPQRASLPSYPEFFLFVAHSETL